MRWSERLPVLLLAVLPATTYAFEVRVDWGRIYLYGLLVAGPGLALSVLPLRRAFGSGRGLALALAVWVAAMPWAVLFATDAITPGIHARPYAYGGLETVLRVWVPGGVVPLALAALAALAVERVGRWRRGRLAAVTDSDPR